MSSARQASVMRAALLAGLVGAVVTATPLVGALNYCCCALVAATGVFAAWIMRSDSAGRATVAQCAAAGLLAGAVAGLVGVPAAAVLSRLAYGTARLEAQAAEVVEAFRQAAEDSGQAPPPGMLEAVEAATRAASGLEMGGWLVAMTLFGAMIYAFFGLIGGFLGALITKRNDVAPPPPGHPPIVVVPPAAPPADAAPGAPLPHGDEPSAPPVLGADGEPDVRWDGPVLEAAPGGTPRPPDAAGDETAVDDPARSGEAGSSGTDGGATGRGEIPVDELPLIPPRPPEASDAPADPERSDRQD